MLGAGLTLVPAQYSLLSTDSEVFFQKTLRFSILWSDKAVIPIEAHFLFEECRSILSASRL